jgi:hypothetical protein
VSDPNADLNQRVIDTFRENGGEVRQFGRGLVVVHHVGVRSGIERTGVDLRPLRHPSRTEGMGP